MYMHAVSTYHIHCIITNRYIIIHLHHLQVARATHLTGPGIYLGDLLRLCLFYWAIVSDALLLKVRHTAHPRHLLLPSDGLCGDSGGGVCVCGGGLGQSPTSCCFVGC